MSFSQQCCSIEKYHFETFETQIKRSTTTAFASSTADRNHCGPVDEIAAPTTDRNRTRPNTSRRIRYDSAWASNRHGRVGQYAAAVRSDTAAPSDAHRKNSDRPPSSQSAAPSVWSMGHYRMKHRPDSLPDWDVLISTRTWPFLPSFRSVLPSAASVWHLAPRILANRWAKIEPEAVSLCVAKGPARRL